MKLYSKLWLCAAFLSVSGCATTTSEGTGSHSAYSQAQAIKGQGGVYKVGNPYKVMGQYYEPTENYSYSEVGIASWYGKDFHAKKTANGEDYDMNTLTAAHRTLPMPSIVKVTNLENGRSLVLRVNDRGPFAKNRIIDISKRGAQLLGFQEQGTAKVRVEVLEKESKELKSAMLGQMGEPLSATPTKSFTSTNIGQSSDTTEPDRRYLVGYGSKANIGKGTFVQAGSFTHRSSAEELKRNLSDVGSANIVYAEVSGSQFYRVRFGPFSSKEDAAPTLNKVKDLGINNARIIQD